MDVITPPVRCDDRNDGLPIVIHEDWTVECCWVIYRPLGLIFEIALADSTKMETAPTEYIASLTYQEEVKPIPPMPVLRKLAKKAIQVFVARTFGTGFGRTSFPSPRDSSVETPCDIDDDIPF